MVPRRMPTIRLGAFSGLYRLAARCRAHYACSGVRWEVNSAGIGEQQRDLARRPCTAGVFIDAGAASCRGTTERVRHGRGRYLEQRWRTRLFSRTRMNT